MERRVPSQLPELMPGRYRFTPKKGPARDVVVTFEYGVQVAKPDQDSDEATPVAEMFGRFEPIR